MEPVNATRAGRSIVLVSRILTLALVISAAAADPAGSAVDHGHDRARPGAPGPRPAPRATAADACAGAASLAVSNRQPRQLLPVRFSAAASTVPPAVVAFYDIDYGDGSDDAGAMPTTVHAYADTGTYLAKVNIVTTCDTVISSPDLRVDVIDGLPPTAAVTFPRANQTVHFGRTGLRLTGTAKDPSGVRKVEIAIQLLSVKRSVTRSGRARAAAAAPKTGCYWFDGKVNLRLHGCATPFFFAAKLRGTHWSFQMNPRSQIPPGVYTVRVRATDRAGNITTVFSPKLSNILAFLLVA